MSRRRPTPSQTVGPFFGFAMPFPDDARAASPGSAGVVHVQGRVLDGHADAVPDALLEAWSGHQFARCRTDPEGAFGFWLRKPGGVPKDAPHIELTVFARGLLRQLSTRIYFPDEQAANATDVILRKVPPGRRHTLIAHRESGALWFDVRLQGKDETVFFAL
jgi:protocatechuate 3,4-dioxygenase, alpha subunit